MSQNEVVNELGSIWEKLVFSYTGEKTLIEKYWQELLNHYTGTERYYHNLNHLHKLIGNIEANKSFILNYHALLFAAFYHDVYYDVSRDDNEMQSAALAEQRLRELKIDKSIITLTSKIIHQTASHNKANNFDIDLFLDFDRDILSSSEEEYREYKEQIRKEYSIFPDKIYKTFRSKFLQQYLSVREIYYTPIYRGRENIARHNLERELKELVA